MVLFNLNTSNDGASTTSETQLVFHPSCQ